MICQFCGYEFDDNCGKYGCPNCNGEGLDDMRYLPTIDLWAPGIQRAISTGQIKLQPGQWVYCGNLEHKSRYVGVRNGSFNVVHWQGNGRSTTEKFNTRIAIKRMEKLYSVDRAAWKVAVRSMHSNLTH